MAKLAPFGRYRAFDASGDPLNGGKLYTYEAGTSTPKVTYTDSGEGTSNPNPVILDSEGYADVWLADGAYKFVLKDSDDVTIWTVDDIIGDAANAFGSTITTTASNLNITSVYSEGVVIATDALTLTLLAADTAGEGFYFIAKNDGSGSVIIDPDASETINGNATYTLAAGESIVVECDGSDWFTLFNIPSTIAKATTFSGNVTFTGDVVLPNGVVDYADIQNVTNNKVLGNLSGSAAAPSEIDFLDEDDMSSDSATAVASQQSIKAYVDNKTAGTLTDYDEYTAYTALSTNIPIDDTIPTSSEGTEILSVTVTTESATQYVDLDFSAIAAAASSGNNVTVALFFGTTCIQVSTKTQLTSERGIPFAFSKRHTPASAASHTYSIRVGSNTGNAFLNGDFSSRLFGGSSSAILKAQVGGV